MTEAERKNKGGFGKGIAIGVVIGAAAVAVAMFLPANIGAITSSQAERIQVSNAHIWVGPDGTSSAAGFIVSNTGGKEISVMIITVRGQSIPASDWYYNSDQSVLTPAIMQRELTYDATLDSIDIGGSAEEEQFLQANGPVVLQPGRSAVIYLDSPAGITAIDAGLAFTLNVSAGKASAVQSVLVVSA